MLCHGALHAAGVVQAGGQRLFTENGFDPGPGGIDRRFGVAIIGRGDGEDIELLFGQHLAVVGIGRDRVPGAGPAVLESGYGFGVEIAGGD